jgi:hypothetical protein
VVLTGTLVLQTGDEPLRDRTLIRWDLGHL